MLRKKTALFFLFLSIGFLLTNIEQIKAFTFQTVCQVPKNTFSNGSTTYDIEFPPGGGTTCDTIGDCPTISLPFEGTVFSLKMEIELTDPSSEIGTPYVWTPTSTTNRIEQIDASDCSLIERYPTGSNPSRTFVVPGGDVWVANRDSNNVTRLSPLYGNTASGGTCGNGACGTDENIYICASDCSGNVCGSTGAEDCRKYEVSGTFASGGGGPRGVTGDINGYVWVGNRDSGNVVKMDPVTGSILFTLGVGGGPYGLVADQYGHVWVSNRGGALSLQCVDTNTNTYTTPFVFPGGHTPYGIGVDKDGNVYVADYAGGLAYKFDAITTSGCPTSMTPSATYNTGAANGSRGIAVDQNGNVWVANSGNNKLSVFTDPANKFSVTPGGTNLIGAAIDADGYGWTVSYTNQKLYKYDFTGTGLNLECSANLSGSPYNYSDMTGLRTVPKKITLGGITVPVSSTGALEICSDGTTTCSDSTPCSSITSVLATCTPNASGECEIPLKIFSMQAGKYTLKNLEIVYGKKVPVTTGGLIPCGREWDDLSTSTIDETDPCTLCHLVLVAENSINYLVEIVGILALLALIISSTIYVASGGNPEKKSAAKGYISNVIKGFVLVLTAWLIVDFVLSIWGYTNPLGGQWNVVCLIKNLL